MNKNKIILITLITIIAILIIATGISYFAIINKINPIFATEKITLSHTDYYNLKFKVVSLEDEKVIKKIKQLSSRINLNEKEASKLVVRKDYKIDFNNGTIIYMQSDKTNGYIESNKLNKSIELPNNLIKLIKDNI